MRLTLQWIQGPPEDPCALPVVPVPQFEKHCSYAVIPNLELQTCSLPELLKKEVQNMLTELYETNGIVIFLY